MTTAGDRSSRPLFFYFGWQVAHHIWWWCRAFAMPRTSKKVVALLLQVVRLPAEGDLGRLGAGFSRLAGSAAFSRVVGSIDGCHVRVKPPKDDAACYLNRKLFYSIQFQAVVDDRARFLDVSRVLKHSPIYFQQMYPPPGYSIIGDGGYPCLEQPISLMTPFRMPHNPLQVRFNSHLSRGRCVVERAFGILKTRWRSIFLKALEVDVLLRAWGHRLLCGPAQHLPQQRWPAGAGGWGGRTGWGQPARTSSTGRRLWSGGKTEDGEALFCPRAWLCLVNVYKLLVCI